MAPQEIESAVARDPRDPSPKVSGAKEVGIAPEFEEDGLRDVFRGGWIGEYTKRDAINQPVVPIVDAFKGSHVTSPHSIHEPGCVFHL